MRNPPRLDYNPSKRRLSLLCAPATTAAIRKLLGLFNDVDARRPSRATHGEGGAGDARGGGALIIVAVASAAVSLWAASVAMPVRAPGF